MLTLDSTCTSCDGKGESAGGYVPVPMLADLSSWDTTALHPNVKLDPTEDHEVVTCSHCNGLKASDGFAYSRYRDNYTPYGDPYKSASTLKAALTRGKATRCKRCRGIGVEAHLPVMRECYTCRGRGTVLTYNADVDPIVPAEVGLTENASPAFMAAWWDSATVVVVRQQRNLTWGEANMGLVGFYSSVDYGRAWNSTDETIIAAVKEHIVGRHGEQFCKFTDRDTRRVGSFLLIMVTRQGYTPVVTDATNALPMLPPAYADRIMRDM